MTTTGATELIVTAPVLRAVCFAVVLPVMLIAHTVADHWVQTPRQAATKHLPGWRGRLACADHVLTYTLTQCVALGLVWSVFDLPLTMGGVLAGQAVSVVSHYWADRRSTLAGLARVCGKDGFYRLGAPRVGRDDNPSLGTGAYALDRLLCTNARTAVPA